MRSPRVRIDRLLNRASRLSGILHSRRFAIVLLVLLLALCFVAAFVPQRSSLDHQQWQAEHPVWAAMAASVQLDRAFTSPLFLMLVGLTALSAGASVVLRFRQARLVRSDGSFWSRIVARRRLVGSLTFHAGLVGIIVAAAWSSLTRSEGSVSITEGQVVALTEEQLANTRTPKIPLPLSAPLELRLDKFRAVHAGSWGTPDYASELTVLENQRPLKQAVVEVNQPLSHRGVTVYQSRHGFSPQIALLDDEGRLRFGSWVALQSDVASNPVRYYDEFMIPGTPLFVEAEFFPDAYLEGDRLRNRSPEPRNCLLEVAIRNGTNTVYQGRMAMGQSVELDSDLHFAFMGVRQWSGLDLVKDHGAGAVFLFAWTALLGLCVRFAPNMVHWGQRTLSMRRPAA